MHLGDGRVLVTSRALYRRKVAVGPRAAAGTRARVVRRRRRRGRLWFLRSRRVAGRANPEFTIPPTAPDQLALLHFTSGTTGTPKGAMHVHEAVVAHPATARFALDLRADDVFWCTADPGWVTGTSYGIIAPLTIGATRRRRRSRVRRRAVVRDTRARARDGVVHRADRDAHDDAGRDDLGTRSRSLGVAVRERASASRSIPKRCCGASTRSVSPIHDNWWQTETGGIMIANFVACDIRPGSMGRPLPGIDADDPAPRRARRRRRPRRRRGRGRRGRGGRARVARPGGRRCSAATSARTSATALLRGRLVPERRSRDAATTTATSGSSGGATTSSSRRAISSDRSRSRAR